jgi:hypothetical protein
MEREGREGEEKRRGGGVKRVMDGRAGGDEERERMKMKKIMRRRSERGRGRGRGGKEKKRVRGHPTPCYHITRYLYYIISNSCHITSYHMTLT